LLSLYRDYAYRALKLAEREKGRPVSLPEVLRAYKRMTGYASLEHHLIWMCLIDIFWDDHILGDKELNYFSIDPKMQHTEENPTGFDVYSDKIAKVFPGYYVDDLLRVRPGPTVPLLNFDSLRDLLLSKDLTRASELDWILANGGTFRFLDGSVNMENNRVSFVSFPRSGNSFLRRFIELITGVVTGSDARLDMVLPLQMCGLAGEGHVSEDNVWITKSHSPLDSHFIPMFHANKMIFLMRNPLDVIPSLCNLLNFGSHSLSPKEEYHSVFPSFWDRIIKQLTSVMKQFFEKNHRNAAQCVPTYFVRYEDLILDPVSVLIELFQFLFEVPASEIAGTVLE
jgi:hypothetical protein